VKWYRRAAEQGVAFAQFNLGVRYANGQGVARDPVQAYRWFGVAAQGLFGREADTARRARDSIKAELTPEQVARGEELVRGWRPKPEATGAPSATPGR
jgi:TPR repeat protein